MLTRQTMADRVKEKLIDDIVKLRLKPNEKLSEQLLADRFGTSRAPVHDALAQLEPMGLVHIVPQSGTFVSEISVRQCYDICDVRLQLETYAVRIVHRFDHVVDQLGETTVKLRDLLAHLVECGIAVLSNVS